MSEKKLLVLARRDHTEAMRVAAGLTICGHAVSLVFMDRPVEENAANTATAELLGVAGIEPRTTVAAMADDLPLLDANGLAQYYAQCQSQSAPVPLAHLPPVGGGRGYFQSWLKACLAGRQILFL